MRQTRLSPGARSRVFLSTLAIFASGALSVPIEAQDRGDRDAVRVSGTVLDIETEAPISAVRFELVEGSTGRIVALVESDSLGVFLFTGVSSGRYTLRIRRIGYQDLAETVTLNRGVETQIDVSLVPDAMALDPIVVTVAPSRSFSEAEFQKRFDAGLGIFVTRKDIDELRPLRVSDTFRRLPGVTLRADVEGNTRILLRGGCHPRVYVNGSAGFESVSLDTVLHPNDIEAIEVYHSAGVPVQYERNACGVVLVWTRQRSASGKKIPFWKGMLVTLSLVGLLIASH